MKFTSIQNLKSCVLPLLATSILLGVVAEAEAQFRPRVSLPVVPGTGKKINSVGDNFENEDWTYHPNLPKSSRNIDGQGRYPTGQSNNGRIYESSYRGQPDLIKRITTPAGGLPNSKGALLLRSLHTGVPKRSSLKSQQDDLLMNVGGIVGRLSVSRTPNFVVRVYFPSWDQWEDATDTAFGLRASVVGTGFIHEGNKDKYKKKRFSLFSRSPKKENEVFWPGMFVQFNSKTDGKNEEDSAMIIIRSGPDGKDFVGPMIWNPGWWTMGMSFTPDGKAHYYASEGVDNLTTKDHIASVHPYGSKIKYFSTFFFNICNQNDGRTWSTPFVIDDPEVFVVK